MEATPVPRDYRAIDACSLGEFLLIGCAPFRHASIVTLCRNRVAAPKHGVRIPLGPANAGFTIAAWFDDPAVAGTDTIDARPGFMAALEMIAGNGVRTIIVETANRFARDLIVQETGWKRLHAEGIALIAADSPEKLAKLKEEMGKLAIYEKQMLASPDQRRETVEHPFGTMKARMVATHFLTKTLPKVAAEMALSVLAYNLTRVMNIVGVKPLIAAIAA
jgi:Resolvase, N terminal domain